MAKRPPKRKKKSDSLGVLLDLLAKVDKDSMRALRAMGKALEIPVNKLRFKTCRFDLNGKHYAARLAPHQCKVILDAVNQNGDVFAAVTKLFTALNYEVACDLNHLSELLDPSQDMHNQTAPLGCCTCDSGKMPNLTQAQCSHFTPNTWTQPPDCSGAPP
jgi:hypothetical protein